MEGGWKLQPPLLKYEMILAPTDLLGCGSVICRTHHVLHLLHHVSLLHHLAPHLLKQCSVFGQFRFQGSRVFLGLDCSHALHKLIHIVHHLLMVTSHLLHHAHAHHAATHHSGLSLGLRRERLALRAFLLSEGSTTERHGSGQHQHINPFHISSFTSFIVVEGTPKAVTGITVLFAWGEAIPPRNYTPRVMPMYDLSS
jgi:hypothetical protein